MGADIAQVNLVEPMAKGAEQEKGLGHSAVELPGVTDVETEPGLGQLGKNLGQFRNASSCRLSFVHVLDQEQILEDRPALDHVDGVRMQNNRESASGGSLQLLDYARFLRGVETAGGMDGNIGKTGKVQLIKDLHQRLQLRETK